MTLPHVVSAIPGPRSLQMYEREQEIIAPGLQSVTQWARVCFSHGRDCALYDLDGNTILDFMAGIGVCSIGHAHPAHVAAISEQAGKLMAGGFTSEARVRALEAMRSILPPSLSRMQFYSGGAEAVEAALRLARCATRRSTILGFWGGYHGKTEGTRSLSEGEQVGYGMSSPGIVLAPYPNPQYGLFGSPEQCLERTVHFVREMIAHGTNRDIAAIIVEPVQGRGGNIVPPPGFLQAVRQVAHEIGALFISDEMITGFFRTGPAFAFMHEECEPDILIMGKGMGNGFPVSGIATTDAIARAEPWSKPSGNSSSYGGNALACAAVAATVETLRDQRLGENAVRVGAAMLERLRKLETHSPMVAEVRGKGVLIGIELAHAENGAEFSREEMRAVFGELLAHGLLVMPSGSSLRINPPLTLSMEAAMMGCEILETVLVGAAVAAR